MYLYKKIANHYWNQSHDRNITKQKKKIYVSKLQLQIYLVKYNFNSNWNKINIKVFQQYDRTWTIKVVSM
jgi:hypothetical protein